MYCKKNLQTRTLILQPTRRHTLLRAAQYKMACLLGHFCRRILKGCTTSPYFSSLFLSQPPSLSLSLSLPSSGSSLETSLSARIPHRSRDPRRCAPHPPRPRPWPCPPVSCASLSSICLFCSYGCAMLRMKAMATCISTSSDKFRLPSEMCFVIHPGSLSRLSGLAYLRSANIINP